MTALQRQLNWDSSRVDGLVPGNTAYNQLGGELNSVAIDRIRGNACADHRKVRTDGPNREVPHAHDGALRDLHRAFFAR